MNMAPMEIRFECVRTIGSAIPMTTKNPVQNLPRSKTAVPELSKSSGLEQRPQIQLGSGASTYVATTSSG